MENNHSLMVYVYPILEIMGYKKEDIVDVSSGNGRGGYPHPDFIISKTIAVEVGNLSTDTKINDLLEKYEMVIWIFSDSKLPLIQCIKFGTKMPNKDYEKEKLKEKVNKLEVTINCLSHELEKEQCKAKSLENMRCAIENIVTSDDKLNNGAAWKGNIIEYKIDTVESSGKRDIF